MLIKSLNEIKQYIIGTKILSKTFKYAEICYFGLTLYNTLIRNFDEFKVKVECIILLYTCVTNEWDDDWWAF